MYNHLYLYHFFTYITCTINRYKDISLYSWLFDSHASTAINSNRIWLISVPFDPIFTWCFTWNNEYTWSSVFPAFHAAVVYTLNIVWLEIEIEMSSRAEQPRAASFRNVRQQRQSRKAIAHKFSLKIEFLRAKRLENCMKSPKWRNDDNASMSGKTTSDESSEKCIHFHVAYFQFHFPFPHFSCAQKSNFWLAVWNPSCSHCHVSSAPMISPCFTGTICIGKMLYWIPKRKLPGKRAYQD